MAGICTGMLSIVLFLILHNKADALSQTEIRRCITSHNKLRALHTNTNPLEWDEGLAVLAQRYAEKLLADHQGRRKTYLVHDTTKNGLGENLYWSDNKKVATCAQADLAWYIEIEDYDYTTARTKNGKAVGHFTQLVWTDTTKFGVGIASGKSRLYADYGNVETFIVAKYAPRGNFHYTGERLQTFTEKVQPRIAGAVTPSLFELDPSMATVANRPCIDKYGQTRCYNFMYNWGYSCEGKYAKLFKKNCYKTCGYC